MIAAWGTASSTKKHLTHSCNRSFIHSSVGHSLIHSLPDSLIHSASFCFIPACMHACMHSFIHAFIHSFNRHVLIYRYTPQIQIVCTYGDGGGRKRPREEERGREERWRGGEMEVEGEREGAGGVLHANKLAMRRCQWPREDGLVRWWRWQWWGRWGGQHGSWHAASKTYWSYRQKDWPDPQPLTADACWTHVHPILPCCSGFRQTKLSHEATAFHTKYDLGPQEKNQRLNSATLKVWDLMQSNHFHNVVIL